MRPALAFAEPRTSPVPHSLVLFVGMGSGPGPELGEALLRAGVRGLWLATPAQALGAAAHARFDAAVVQLDDAMALAARHFDHWRRVLRCPLLVLSEVDDEIDEIIALELGADGVLPRPVTARRLRAHLLTLLRRPAGEGGAAPAPEPPPATAAAGWVLDRVHNRLSRGGRQVQLTELQAALMQVLLAEVGRVVPRARLLAAVSHGRELRPRSVDVYVARLRLRLQQERVDDLQIEGVRGRGYALATGAPRRPGGGAAVAPTPPLAWIAPAVAMT